MEISQNIKQCQIYKNEEATILCFNCHNYFCEACSKFVHDKKKNRDHTKEKIDSFVPIDFTCQDNPDHERVPLNLFCVDEKGK